MLIDSRVILAINQRLDGGGDDEQDGLVEPSKHKAQMREVDNLKLRYNRTIAPFIPSVDIPRGLIQALQSLLHYVLMLSVM